MHTAMNETPRRHTSSPSVEVDNERSLDIARALLDRYQGDEERAVSALVAKATREIDLRATLVENGARELLRQVISATRASVMRSVNRPTDTESNQRLRRVVSMYSYPLMGGISLGQACHEHLSAQATEHERNELANAAKKRLFQELAQRTAKKPTTPLRELLSENDLKAAFRKHGVEA